MAIVQISKILIRRGPEADLPGEPSSFEPLAFSTPLDVGELAFATDTGRLFIGHDPEEGQANYARTTRPYQNIEVLTEASTETLSRIISTALRATGKASYASATLDTTTDDDWSPVEVGDEAFTFSGPNLAAAIEYSVFTSLNRPVRGGVMQVYHPGDNTPPSLTDDAITHARLELGGASNYDPAAVFGSLRFRFTMATVAETDIYTMEYQNRTGVGMKMFLRHSRIVP